MKPVSFSTLVLQTVMLLVLGIVGMQASAESENEIAGDVAKAESLPSVKAWLELQRSGKAASEQPQPLSGPVMDQVQERYLKNFTHPVPPYFEHVQPIDN